jgi:uncharacterized protein
MLIQFSVTNHGAVCGTQTLSMAASAACKELPQNTFEAELPEKCPALLKAAALYGPNASGKSTLVDALGFMEHCVLTSHKETQAGDAIQARPFKLSAASRSADSEFEITFAEGGVRYEYGFKCNTARFTEEWLIAYPKGRAQKWFHRVTDPATGQDEYRFSNQFESESRRQGWRKDTRPNALFLSKAMQSNCEQLKPVFDWFHKRLGILHSNTSHPAAGVSGYTIARCKNTDTKKRIVDFMTAADIPISDIRIDWEKWSEASLPEHIPMEIRADFVARLTGKEVVKKINFIRKDESGADIEFDIGEESEGTQGLFGLAGPWLDLLDHDRVLVVDELDASLHPLMVQNLVSQFHRLSKKSQLIFTTHDTSLLAQPLLRRDQVWLLHRDEKQASQWCPLTDYSPRMDDALERRYLNGRFNAIPLLKDGSSPHGL